MLAVGVVVVVVVVAVAVEVMVDLVVSVLSVAVAVTAGGLAMLPLLKNIYLESDNSQSYLKHLPVCN